MKNVPVTTVDETALSSLFRYVQNVTMEIENAANEAGMSFDDFRDAMSDAGYDVHNVRKKYKIVTFEDLANL